MKLTLTLSASLCALLLASSSYAAPGIDGVSVDYGSGDKTEMLRVGVQSNWDVKWFAGNGQHLGGYWDVSFASWQQNKYKGIQGNKETLTDIGFTPVFRWQNDNLRGLYFEGGIGLNRLSKLYDNDGARLSTLFQFGDHVGVGYVFDNNWEIGAKIQHFSNGGYRKPNHGVNFFDLKAAYRF
jgi:lipid A 3-O-deacylase